MVLLHDDDGNSITVTDVIQWISSLKERIATDPPDKKELQHRVQILEDALDGFAELGIIPASTDKQRFFTLLRRAGKPRRKPS